jgi:hypothetical protein
MKEQNVKMGQGDLVGGDETVYTCCLGLIAAVPD